MIRAVKDSATKINCTQLISKNSFLNRQKDQVPQPALTKWWFNGEVIDNIEPGSDTLFIERTTLTAEGNYTCEQFGDARASIYLKVQGKCKLFLIKN